MTRLLTHLDAKWLSRLSHERRSRNVRETTNAMRAHLKLEGRL